ncbi:hypothetical protein Rumeso_02902 [Rubellimicrobium mesophilum DSM 19309]|uniref:Uncharacterized protein n=1 Tax=Rubellimicrobium mesophilum DSM 19309 TaxID=442562 RepID=A0A017HMJ6_9RHOB|nr:hypothetical protein Rumeso_02902 [Rubellimicrobium mesophilum DSM 19309]
MHDEVRHTANQARAVDSQRKGPGLWIGTCRPFELGRRFVAPQIFEHPCPSLVLV